MTTKAQIQVTRKCTDAKTHRALPKKKAVSLFPVMVFGLDFEVVALDMGTQSSRHSKPINLLVVSIKHLEGKQSC